MKEAETTQTATAGMSFITLAPMTLVTKFAWLMFYSFLIVFILVVFFLLGDSPASEFSMPTTLEDGKEYNNTYKQPTRRNYNKFY
jgi:hypothetical protein